MGSILRPTAPPGAEFVVAVRRFVNDEIAHVATRLDPDDMTHYEFVCECGDLSCRRTATSTVAEYHASPPGSVVCHPVLAA